MQSPVGNQLWCPGQSLWSLISEYVPGSELPKIRAALGHSLVDMYTEVHTEAEMWHNMWQESQRGNNNSSSRPGTPLPRLQGSVLADPPAVKELVRAEVKMLLQSLRERASGVGRDGEELLFRYKPETVDYALGHLDSCYRSCTSPEDTERGSRPGSHCSVQSNAEEEIEAVRDKLNVTDIDQVVDRLKSVLMEECEALNRLVKHLKGNIKQKCRSQREFYQSEPSLAELRELRRALQMDLELYPSSLAALPSASSPLRLKHIKTRLSADQTVSDGTLQASSTAPALRPRPPPHLPLSKPRPPLSAPPSKTSVKPNHSSSLSHGQHRSTSASTGPFCDRTTSSGHASGHFTASVSGPSSDQITFPTVRKCSLAAEQDRAGPHCRTPTSSPSFQRTTLRKSPARETHLSSHRSVHSQSRECVLSAQTERKSSPAWRTTNVSSRCAAGSDSSNGADHPETTTGRARTQSGRQNSTCAGSLEPAAVQTDKHRRKSTSDSFQSGVTGSHSVMSETESSSAQTYSSRSNDGTDRNTNGHLRRDVTQQRSLVATATYSDSMRINGQLFTSPKRPLEGTASHPKSIQEAQPELEFINKFYQPAPPARVLS